MQVTLKSQLIKRFIAVIFITSLISSIVGTLLINKWTVGQAQERVSNALNFTRETLNRRIENIKDTVYLTSIRRLLKEALLKKDRTLLKSYLDPPRKKGNLDLLNITDEKGTIVFRAKNSEVFGDHVDSYHFIKKVLSTKETVSSIEVIPYEEIKKEGDEIISVCDIKPIETPKSKKNRVFEEGAALALISASPILDEQGRLVGVLWGGEVLNKDYEMVDKIKDIVFQKERYEEKEIGTVTIFLRDLRISTNVRNEDGTRAIGTLVSEEVYNHVLEKGRSWIGRAFVVNDWYVSAYEPIRNLQSEIIGILYVGMLEKVFADMRKETLVLFFAITLFGVMLSIMVSTFLADTLVKPINYLVKVSNKISQGDFSARVEERSKNEIGDLEKTFARMASSLQEREQEIKRLNEQHLILSEKLASIGRLAAGIAHEINNPLTTILTFSSLLLRKAEVTQKEKLETIIKETTRCREIIKGLLNFARQNEPVKEVCSVNDIIENAVSLTRNQLKVHENKITVEKELENIPSISIDPNQMLEVFINIIINAIDAMPKGGTLKIMTRREDGRIEIKFVDTGHGIIKEHLDQVFDPFFTTKEAGKGTGLGLAVTYGIIERHNGMIDVESEVGKGTTFVIKLPVE